MDDEELVYVDTTDKSSHRDNDDVTDEKKEEFRKILKSTAMKKNVDNIVESFMDGDPNDQERLVELLEEHRVNPENVNAIFNRWFHVFPKNVGIDVYRSRRDRLRSADSGEEIDSDPTNIVKDVAKREAAALASEINMMEAQKLKLSLKKQLKEFDHDDSTKTTERMEPVMIMDDDGNVEVATDKEGKPITKRIIEPINSGGGSSSLTDMMMMQKILVSDNKPNGNDGMSVIKIQDLENKITRLKDRSDSENDRHKDRIDEKDKEISSIKEKTSEEISRVKEENVKEIERIRESNTKEISDMQKRHDDKIENIEQRHHDNVSAINDRHTASEERLLDKMDRVESDAADSISGLQYRHQEELSRLHADYKQQIGTFVTQSRGDLDSVKTMHQMETVHRDKMDVISKEHESNMKVLEKRIEDSKNMSVGEKQNEKIIEAVSSGLGSAFDAFGKPYVANMQTQQLINQKNIAEDAMARRQAKIDEMRGAGHTDEEISFVVDGNADRAHDEAYEQILQEEELIPVERNEPEQQPSQQPSQTSPPIMTKPIMVVR